MVKNLLLVGLLSISGPLFAEKGSLERCQKVLAKIDKYNELRSDGGKASRMESWIKSRNKYKEKFRSLSCKKWQRQFK